MKAYLKFIFLFTGIFACYIFMITNISEFLTDYDGSFKTYTNIYSTSFTEDNTISNIFDSSKISLATLDEINELIEEDYLLSILSVLYDDSKENIRNTLLNYTKMKMINIYTNPKYKENIFYTNIGSIETEQKSNQEDNDISSMLLFTSDLENIYHKSYRSGACKNSNYVFEKTTNDIDFVNQNVKNLLRDMGVLDRYNFEFTSIRNTWLEEYGIIDGNYYFFIEDYRNNIKIEYDLLCNEIHSLQIGFN